MRDIVYFFYLTNKRDVPVEEIVWESNERCNQENLIAQLTGPAASSALEKRSPGLLRHWAYMVMAFIISCAPLKACGSSSPSLKRDDRRGCTEAETSRYPLTGSNRS